MFERWGTVCHKCSFGCYNSSSCQKHQKLRCDDLPPPTCMYLDTWLPSELEELPVPESSFCDILWAKNLNRFIGGSSASSCELVQWEEFGSRALMAFFRFLFVIVSDLFRFSFYIVFQNLFEHLYSFSIAFCISCSINYSNTITFWSSISFSYGH